MTRRREHSEEVRPQSVSGRESESLLRLVDELTDRMSRGEAVDFEAELAAHPADAERLREVFAGLELLQVIHDSGATRTDSAGTPPLGEPAAGLLGDFRILREVGRGGMGVVYEAEQISLGRRVALKVFPFAGICAPRQLQRFQHEARAAASLHHPHIVPVFAVGCERGLHFYAMQYIDGRSLADVLGELRPTATEIRAAAADGSAATKPEHAAAQTVRQPISLSCRQVAEWGAQAAEALDYAHTVGIVHRDIKPANLLLDDRQRLWVTDFGLAQIATADGLTMTGDILGTLKYMSPEQAGGERGLVDQRTDVYSLGATLYELLTSQPVFGSADRAELLRKILHADPEPLRKLSPEVPVELATIVHKCLEREPESRYATASRLADDLRRFLNDQPIRAKPPTWADRVRKWSRRNRGLVRLLTVCSVMGLAVLLTSAVLIDRERQRTRFEQQARRTEERSARTAQRGLALNHYVSQLTQAQRSFQAGKFSEARTLLNECLPKDGAEDFRGFEWHYLQQMTRERAPPAARHQGMAYCARLSPDGKLLATGGQDGIRLWDAESFEPLGHLTAHGTDVNGIAFSADGLRMASAGDDGNVRIWSTTDWNVEQTIPHTGHVVAAMFVPGKNLLVSAERHIEDAQRVRRGEDVVRLWDTQTWEPQGTLQRHADYIQSLDVSPDGSLVASGGDDHKACLWDLNEHRLHRELKLTFGSIRCVAFAPASPILATASADGSVQAWNTPDGSPLVQLNGVYTILQFVAFSPGEQTMITGGDLGTISMWDWYLPTVNRRRCGLFLHSPAWKFGAAFLDDRHFVTVDRDGLLQRWDSQDLFDHRRLPLACESPTELIWLPDSRHLACAGRGVGVHDARTGTRIRELAPADHGYRELSLATDGQVLSAVEEEGGQVHWNTRDWTRQSRPAKAEQRSVSAGDHLIRSPRKFVRAVVKADGAVQVWRNDRLAWESPHRIQGFLTGTVSDDGTCVAIAQSDGRIRLLDEEQQVLDAEHLSDSPVAAIDFSPDGKTLAGTLQDLHFVRLWNTATGRQLLDLESEATTARHPVFSPDGKSLAAIGRNSHRENDLLLWETASPAGSQ